MPQVSYPAALAVHVGRDPHHPALIHEGHTVTRAQLHAAAAARAKELLASGVGHGDLVAVQLPNGVAFFEAVVAAWMVGAVPLPLSARLTPAETEAVLAVARPAAVVHDPAPVGDLPCDDAPSEPALFDGAPFDPAPSDPALFDPALFDPALFDGAVSPHWKAIATGGSTGVPKVVLDTRPALADPMQPVNFMRLDGTQLVAGPLYHSGPFINAVTGLLAGATLVLMSRFDAEHALALIERHRVDWALLVPTMALRIRRLDPAVRDRYDVSSLQAVMSSGGAYPAWLKAEMIDWLGPDRIYEAYGGTELVGGTLITGHESLEHPGSVGRCRPDCLMRILDDDGTEVAPGTVGQVWFAKRDGRVTYHYLGAEERGVDGWDTFGDLGWVDADGYLYLADRRTDLIVSGGVNVYPAEVEAAVESHPSVRSCVVVGLTDDELGRRVHAIVDVVDAPRTDATLDDLRAHVAARLSRPKQPRSWELVTEPLRDDAGKVRRAALRQERDGGGAEVRGA